MKPSPRAMAAALVSPALIVTLTGCSSDNFYQDAGENCETWEYPVQGAGLDLCAQIETKGKDHLVRASGSIDGTFFYELVEREVAVTDEYGDPVLDYNGMPVTKWEWANERVQTKVAMQVSELRLLDADGNELISTEREARSPSGEAGSTGKDTEAITCVPGEQVRAEAVLTFVDNDGRHDETISSEPVTLTREMCGITRGGGGGGDGSFALGSFALG